MRHIKLTIEYDGTNYAGWQIQPNGLAIQEVMEGALARMLGESVRLRSSGRTDAGVHAHGMVACFTTEKGLPLRAFREGLNANLPPDIAVRDASEVPLYFNPRYHATGKHYRYTIQTRPLRAPLSRLYSWRLGAPLDIEAMREGCRRLVGKHDFAAFRGSNCAAKTTVRTIHSLELREEGEFLHLEVNGSGFLKNMVRVMTGTLVEVGQGRMTPDDISRLLKTGDRRQAGMTAPPQGLCLMEVFYPEELIPLECAPGAGEPPLHSLLEGDG
ncbi:tRNA pseudouridine(38-40) synthase TruA [Geomonas sp. RF6]|nr:tRNA pseudouridine(38-40) synthase TruA [Geomonas sp. RF6]UFS68712.1 tRNA pseudouridine(38-40) synthase TruA [Geomonas sp. RF6]